MTAPIVSVVMSVFNGERFLPKAVESILSQSYRNFEFIVIDDGSTDSSPEILESYRTRDLRVKVYRKENSGIVDSLNLGCRLARGRYIARMDADDVCALARLERQVTFLDSHLEVGLVGCGMYDNIDGHGATLYTTYLPQDNEAIQRTIVQRWCFLHPSIMFRTELFNLVGGYRKVFESAEDHDFILRILEHSQAHNLQEPLIRYRVNPKGLSVVYHQYMNELGEIAMELAQRRRRGESENLASELQRLTELKLRRKAPGGLEGLLQRLRDSLYAANRYYGFGCRELCAGRMQSARRCYLVSLRTNAIFLKSWLGLVLSLLPPVARQMRFLFSSSMQHERESRDLQPTVDSASAFPPTVAGSVNPDRAAV